MTLGHLGHAPTLLSLFGLLLMAALMTLRIRGAILIGMLITTVAGILVGAGPVPDGIGGIVSLDVPSFMPTFLKLDVMAAIEYGLISVLFTMTMVDLFDSMGTLIGVSRKAGLMDSRGEIRGLGKALIVDSCGTILSGLMGTPAVTSYVESSAGVADGGRTGLMAVTAGVLFLVSLVFAPLAGIVQSYSTAPALIMVGALMIQDIRGITFDDVSEGLPAFLTVITIPLTYSIATGFGIGFISYVLLKTITGRIREVSAVMWVVAFCFGINFALR